jgi:hypothetical protein
MRAIRLAGGHQVVGCEVGACASLRLQLTFVRADNVARLVHIAAIGHGNYEARRAAEGDDGVR